MKRKQKETKVKDWKFWLPFSQGITYADTIEKSGDTYLIGNVTDLWEPKCRLFSISRKTEIASFPCSRGFSVNLSSNLAFIVDEDATSLVSLRDHRFPVVSVIPRNVIDIREVASNDRVMVSLSSFGLCKIFSSDGKYLKSILPIDVKCVSFLRVCVTENHIFFLSYDKTPFMARILVFSLDGEYQYHFERNNVMSIKAKSERLYCLLESRNVQPYSLQGLVDRFVPDPELEFQVDFPNDFCIDEKDNVHCLGRNVTIWS